MVKAAVAGVPGTATLLISDSTPTVSTTDAGWAAALAEHPGFGRVRWNRRLMVPATTLDRLIENFGRPRFCKLDIEGAEPAALVGLSQPVPVLSFEYLPAVLDRAHAAIDRLSALGDYRFNAVVAERLRLQFGDWRSADAMRRWLDARGVREPAGDVYACCVNCDA